jgi:NTE family protein
MKSALVLSGGSIKGAFQAGAIAEVLEREFAPDAIYGTSVGSLNGAFLAERAGRARPDDAAPDWPAIGRGLESFWRDNITSSKKIARKRNLFELLIAIVCKKFNGLVDTKPLQGLVKEVLKADNLRRSPVQFYACAVNLATGQDLYAAQDNPNILDYIIASTAIPIEMPAIKIGPATYVDGGIREVAPLKRAIDEGAQEITCIVCHPQSLQGASFDPGNLFELAPRLMDIVTNELVNNDLVRIDKVNAWVGEFEGVQRELRDTLARSEVAEEVGARLDAQLSKMPYNEWRQVNLRVIRPEAEIALDLLNFTPEQIREVIKLGRDTAKKVLDSEP